MERVAKNNIIKPARISLIRKRFQVRVLKFRKKSKKKNFEKFKKISENFSETLVF